MDMDAEALPARWAELFGEPAPMRLASADDGTGGHGGGRGSGNEDLAHSGGPWTRAAAAAGDLGLSMDGALGKMTAAHEGVASGTSGFESTTALATVRTSWDKRLTAVREECRALRPQLMSVARDIGEVDEQYRISFSQLAVRQEPKP
ncbi:hypothetical protein CP980_08360 [Streptomyces vinaceus]|uniref:Uncharacterized protein n=1 Tax=Streptomyces vinaceus TaxID=1960 RepID=A0A5J6J5V4_STRVI|nr:hypothetical protein [Streptomyces vinaceus]QEV45071.1 hypothetical protein CP980_08360 [Streptomyces vinaceus]GHE51557.1 hypothetical protein GCM10017778_39700 [Streptomyces vinaceus]